MSRNPKYSTRRSHRRELHLDRLNSLLFEDLEAECAEIARERELAEGEGDE